MLRCRAASGAAARGAPPACRAARSCSARARRRAPRRTSPRRWPPTPGWPGTLCDRYAWAPPCPKPRTRYALARIESIYARTGIPFSMPGEQPRDYFSEDPPFGFERIDLPADIETRPHLQPAGHLVGQKNAPLAQDLLQKRPASEAKFKIGRHRGTKLPSDAVHVFLIDGPRLAENAEIDVDQLRLVRGQSMLRRMVIGREHDHARDTPSLALGHAGTVAQHPLGKLRAPDLVLLVARNIDRVVEQQRQQDRPGIVELLLRELRKTSGDVAPGMIETPWRIVGTPGDPEHFPIESLDVCRIDAPQPVGKIRTWIRSIVRICHDRGNR